MQIIHTKKIVSFLLISSVLLSTPMVSNAFDFKKLKDTIIENQTKSEATSPLPPCAGAAKQTPMAERWQPHNPEPGTSRPETGPPGKKPA